MQICVPVWTWLILWKITETKFKGVLPLLYFAWVEVSNVNTGIEQMASCPWTRMPDEVLTLPFPLPAIDPPSNATSKSPRFGPQPHNDNSKQGRGSCRHTEESLGPAGALFWGHSAITVRSQANLFLLKYLHRSHIPSTWNGRVIFSVDWGEIVERWPDRWHGSRLQRW